MLSSVLRSERAIQMNIAIMRAFVRLRELMAAHKDIAARVEKLERGQARAASVIEVLVEDIDRLGRKVGQIKSTEATLREMPDRIRHGRLARLPPGSDFSHSARAAGWHRRKLRPLPPLTLRRPQRLGAVSRPVVTPPGRGEEIRQPLRHG
jgi:hypothetical protein